MFGLGIKVAKLGKDAAIKVIKNSPIPTRYKKFFQGETLGEAKIKPAAKSMRSTVPFEIKAFVTGAGGALSIPAIYNYLTSEKKQSMRKMAEAMDMKPKPKPKKKVSNVGKNPPMGAGIRRVSIKKGDTLSAIARKNNTTVSTLKKLNPNVKPREMKIGGSLKIPRTGGTR
tara:strand:+ start:20 stop:532 length:513 start_codon:yes stop_codon:yes gene_type:complete